MRAGPAEKTIGQVKKGKVRCSKAAAASRLRQKLLLSETVKNRLVTPKVSKIEQTRRARYEQT